MEDTLEALSLPGLLFCIFVGTIILARLDGRARRKIEEAGVLERTVGEDTSL